MASDAKGRSTIQFDLYSLFPDLPRGHIEALSRGEPVPADPGWAAARTWLADKPSPFGVSCLLTTSPGDTPMETASALEMCLALKYPDKEIVVLPQHWFVDDETCGRLVANRPDVRVLPPGSSVADLVASASKPYVTLLDPSIRLHPLWLGYVASHLVPGTAVAASHHAILAVDDSGTSCEAALAHRPGGHADGAIYPVTPNLELGGDPLDVELRYRKAWAGKAVVVKSGDEPYRTYRLAIRKPKSAVPYSDFLADAGRLAGLSKADGDSIVAAIAGLGLKLSIKPRVDKMHRDVRPPRIPAG